LLKARFGNDLHIRGDLVEKYGGALALTVRGDGVQAKTFTAPASDLDSLGRGDWVGAQKAYADAVALAPDLPAGYYSRGVALLQRGNLDGAISKLTDAHLKGPHWADPLKAWGDVLALLVDEHDFQARQKPDGLGSAELGALEPIVKDVDVIVDRIRKIRAGQVGLAEQCAPEIRERAARIREVGFAEIHIARLAGIEHTFFQEEAEERRIGQDTFVEFQLRHTWESRPICTAPIDPQCLAFLQHDGSKPARLHLHQAQVTSLEFALDELALREREFAEIARGERTRLEGLPAQGASPQVEARELALEEFIGFFKWHDRISGVCHSC
jgi:hypothetical protein